MKLFLSKLIGFLIVLFISLNIFCFIGESLRNEFYINFFNEKDFAVKLAIDRSKRNFKSETILLGNSVAGQIYGTTSDEKLYAITSTMAITLVGQFLLLQNFIDANYENLPDKVIIYESPTCFNTGPFNKFAYNIFLRNFYRKEYFKQLSPLAIKNISNYDFYYLAPYIWYRNMSFIPNNIIRDNSQDVIIEPVTFEYFYKICKLCEDNNIELSFKAIPLRESKKIEIYKYIQSFPVKNNKIINDFFESVCFMPDSLYNSGMHFYQNKIPKDLLNIYSIK